MRSAHHMRHPGVHRTIPLLILLVSSFLRLYRLPTMPWGLSQDEIVNADISLQLLQGGRVPFLTGGFGHEPLFHYLQATTLRLFGDNVMGIRMPASLVGIVLLAVVYRFIRRLLGPFPAITAMTGLGISWWGVVFSRLGIRAISFPLVSTSAVLFLWKGLAQRRQNAVLLAGVLFGISFYTYTSAQMLPAMALTCLAYLTFFRRDLLVPHWRALLATAIVSAAIAAPLYVYLYAHPELRERFSQLSGPLDALRAGDPIPVLKGSLATLAMFSHTGEARWTYGIPQRPLLGPIFGALFYLGAIRSVLHPKQIRGSILMLWLVVMLLPSMFTPDAPSTIRAIGAIPAAFGLVGWGGAWIWQWLSRTPAKLPRVGFATILGGAAIMGLRSTYLDHFQVWARHPEVYWRYKSHFADIAAFLDTVPPTTPSVVFETWVDSVDVQGLRRNLGNNEREPRWTQKGKAFLWPADVTHFVVAVPGYTVLDPNIKGEFMDPSVQIGKTAYSLGGQPAVRFYDVRTEPRLSRLLERVRTSTVSTPEGDNEISPPLDFETQLRLLGYQVLPGHPDLLQIYTVWRVLEEPVGQITLFLHALDTNGNLLTQQDTLDVWPGTLQQGDTFVQLHELSRSECPDPDTCILQLGAYTRPGLVRLQISQDGHPVSDRVWLHW